MRLFLGLLAFIVSLMVIAGVGAIILTAYHGVIVGDDYVALKEFSMADNWMLSTYDSLTHTGRYMQSILSSVSYGLFGEAIPVVLPAITIIWLTILLFLFSRIITRKHQLSSSWAINATVALITLFLIASLNRPLIGDGTWFAYQMLFFSSAIITYTIPALVVLTAIYAVVHKGYFVTKRGAWSLVLFGLTIYLMGLSNETLPATTVAISPIVLVSIFIKTRKITLKTTASKYTIVATVASMLSLLTLYFSPSSVERRLSHKTEEGFDITGAVLSKLEYMFNNHIFIKSDIVLLAVISLLIAVLIGLHIKRMRTATLARTFSALGATMLACSIMAILVATVLLVFGYGPYTPIYPRTLIIFQILYVTGGIMLGVGFWLAVISLRKWLQWYTILVVCSGIVLACFILPGNLNRSSNQILASINYSQEWHNTDSYLGSTAGQHREKIITINESAAGIGDGFSLRCYGENLERPNWLGRAMSAYYGVPQICSNSSPIE